MPPDQPLECMMAIKWKKLLLAKPKRKGGKGGDLAFLAFTGRY